MLHCGLWWGKTAQATPRKGVLASTFYLNRWGALRLPQSNYPIHKLGPRWLEEATAGDQAAPRHPQLTLLHGVRNGGRRADRETLLVGSA